MSGWRFEEAFQAMLNLGSGEIAVILVLALLILGPQRLPQLARGIGKFLAEFRRQTDEVRSVVQTEFYRMDQEMEKYTSLEPGTKTAPAREGQRVAFGAAASTGEPVTEGTPHALPAGETHGAPSVDEGHPDPATQEFRHHHAHAFQAQADDETTVAEHATASALSNPPSEPTASAHPGDPGPSGVKS